MRKEAEIAAKLGALREKIAAAPTDTAAADRVIVSVEGRRGALDRTFVCVDFDAFFAAVSELDDASLRGKAHAVGGGENGVLSTSSYVARSFGVRSAMPTYIARRLCPHLIIVKSNFARYIELSKIAKETVFCKYGAFEMRSIDEAIIDITHYLAENEVSAEVAVERLRTEVREATGGLTVSAGVAATPTLSKICADMNKPDGAYHLGSSRAEIVAFCAGLALRKVPGLGKVTERYLTDGFGISTVGEILGEKRAALCALLSERTFEFLCASALGVSCDEIGGYHGPRKSVGRGRTMGRCSDAAELRKHLSSLCDQVAADIARLEGIDGGRCLTLTLKKSDFTQLSRSKTVPSVMSSADDINKVLVSLLNAELPVEARLLGVRISSLAGPLVEADKAVQDPKQSKMDCFFTSSAKRKRCGSDAEDEEGEDHDDEIPPLPDSPKAYTPPLARRIGDPGPAYAAAVPRIIVDSETAPISAPNLVVCPVCEKRFTELNLNHHLDLCLNLASGLVPSPKRRKGERQQARMNAFVTRGK